MKLTDTQVATFEDEGYLFLPGLFSAAEVGVLNDAAAEIYASDREEVWRESSGVARTAFAAHTYDEAHRRLAAHPRLIKPIEQILDGKLYMHQYKINAKAAFDGEVWQWHQDFGTWHRDDGMPAPRAMNIRPRSGDDQLSVVDLGPRNGQPIGRRRRLCRADRPGRQRVDVLLAAGSRQPAKHQSAAAHDCLSIALPRG